MSDNKMQKSKIGVYCVLQQNSSVVPWLHKKMLWWHPSCIVYLHRRLSHLPPCGGALICSSLCSPAPPYPSDGAEHQDAASPVEISHLWPSLRDLFLRGFGDAGGWQRGTRLAEEERGRGDDWGWRRGRKLVELYKLAEQHDPVTRKKRERRFFYLNNVISVWHLNDVIRVSWFILSTHFPADQLLITEPNQTVSN